MTIIEHPKRIFPRSGPSPTGPRTAAPDSPVDDVACGEFESPTGPRTAAPDSPADDVVSGEFEFPVPVSALPVSTLRHAARVALHRTRRLTVLGAVPVVGLLVMPWLWPLHMAIVGLTAGNIRQTPDASLSFYDGSPAARYRSAVLVALLAAGSWLALLSGTWCVIAGVGQPAVATMILVATVLPAVAELLALISFAALNPEWITIKRAQARRTDGRTTYVLTSLVSRQDGHDFAAVLMALTYPGWSAADAVVIGYPADKSLISYYVRLGARRERSADSGVPHARRQISFDCRRPLRMRTR